MIVTLPTLFSWRPKREITEREKPLVRHDRVTELNQSIGWTYLAAILAVQGRRRVRDHVEGMRFNAIRFLRVRGPNDFQSIRVQQPAH